MKSTLQMNVWSNPQAVLDYQQFLDGVKTVSTTDCDAVVVSGKNAREQAWAGFLHKLNPRGNDVMLGLVDTIPIIHPVSGSTDFPGTVAITMHQGSNLSALISPLSRSVLVRGG